MNLISENLHNTFDIKDTEGTLTKLRDVFYDCAKQSRIPRNRRQIVDAENQQATTNDMSIATNNKNEHAAWTASDDVARSQTSLGEDQLVGQGERSYC